jgi:acetyl-CoA carboxylase biotin carboxylase subunit/3-methylcrotonyl-CoA carboxylase alpha subunit
MPKKVLIANRGEIAVRIARTCRRLGIATAGVHSEADAGSPHTQAVDVSVLIGAAAVRESYLNVEKILAAALETGADAVHPGYGLLSEKAHFAQAVREAGLIFIGPPGSALDRLGDKMRARETARTAGVAHAPGSDGPVDGIDDARAVATRVGFPLLVKPVGGGGGIGMQIVRDEASLEKALKAAADRGAQAFGDARVYLERYVAQPRHVEVQIFGDAHGNVVALGERECSVQRRHQKIIEESPAPAFGNRADGSEHRARIHDAAIRVAKAAGYQNAGTCEFIWEDARASSYFLEVNCRLQVEHPVTEMVTGLDLVELQLRVADGQKLPDAVTAGVKPQGHAIEVRLYAEDPSKGFIPKPGNVDEVRWPEGEGVRVDAGVAAGGKVTPYYDPMIAKIITHGRDRAEAIERMKAALANTHLAPVVTNLAFLRGLVASDEFARGVYDTGFAEAFAKRKPPA